MKHSEWLRRKIAESHECKPRQVVAKSPTESPWTIFIILPNCRHYALVKFWNRQDAQDHLTFLKRRIPDKQFELIFDRK